MNHSPAQKFFLDLVEEAAVFLDASLLQLIRVSFSDNPAIANAVLFPQINIIEVNLSWLESCIEAFKPTTIRATAYGLLFGFAYYKCFNALPPLKHTFIFSQALCMVNGIPNILNLFNDTILECLKKCTGHDFIMFPVEGADGSKALGLSLAENENKLLIKNFKTWQKDACKRKIAFDRGSKDMPFENIDEAFSYIEEIERREVEKDPFLNSGFCGPRYKYNVSEGRVGNKPIYSGMFKIPWAATYTALSANDFPADSFIVTQLAPSDFTLKAREWLLGKEGAKKLLPLFSLKPNLYRRRFLYRGQIMEYVDSVTGLPTCRPNAYRRNYREFLVDKIKFCEFASIVASFPMVRKLGVDGIKIFNEPFHFQLNLQGLAQHYYGKTQFIDLTSDSDTAKFFATCQWDDGTDSYNPYFSDEPGILYVYDMRLPEEFKISSPTQLSTIGKQYAFHRSGMQHGFLLGMPRNMDLHDLSNVYRIYFRQDSSISHRIWEEAKRGEKYFPKDDPLYRHWDRIRHYANRDFPVSRKARELYLLLYGGYGSMGALDNDLRELDFMLEERDWPVIPRDILDDYYVHEKELWKEFVSDIYFWGNEGAFMKRAFAMHNL